MWEYSNVCVSLQTDVNKLLSLEALFYCKTKKGRIVRKTGTTRNGQRVSERKSGKTGGKLK